MEENLYGRKENRIQDLGKADPCMVDGQPAVQPDILPQLYINQLIKIDPGPFGKNGQETPHRRTDKQYRKEEVFFRYARKELFPHPGSFLRMPDPARRPDSLRHNVDIIPLLWYHNFINIGRDR